MTDLKITVPVKELQEITNRAVEIARLAGLNNTRAVEMAETGVQICRLAERQAAAILHITKEWLADG